MIGGGGGYASVRPGNVHGASGTCRGRGFRKTGERIGGKPRSAPPSLNQLVVGSTASFFAGTVGPGLGFLLVGRNVAWEDVSLQRFNCPTFLQNASGICTPYRRLLVSWSKLKAKVSGCRWGYLGRMNEGLSGDGAAILQAMKIEFLIDE